MLKIRLQRIGKRGQAYFKVIVTEHTRKPKGKYLELLGSYDPHKNEMKVDAEKVKHWLSRGAKMSPTVNNLLVGRGVIEGEKVKVWKPKSQRKEVGTPTETSEKKPAVVSEAKQTNAPSPQAETKETEVKKEKTEEPVTEIPVEEERAEKPMSSPAETSIEIPTV